MLLAIKMKIGFRKLILLLPSVQHLYGNPTCRVWTSSFKIKLHFWSHQGLLCCVPSPIPYEQNQWEAKQYLKNQTFKAFYESDTPNIRTYTGKHAHCVQAEDTFRVEFSPLDVGLRIPTDQMCKKALEIFCVPGFFHADSWTCEPFTLFFTVFAFALYSYTEVFPLIKHARPFKTQISYRNQCIICGKSVSVKWSNPASHCVHYFPNTETLSIWKGGCVGGCVCTFLFLKLSSGPYKFDCSWHFWYS